MTINGEKYCKEGSSAVADVATTTLGAQEAELGIRSAKQRRMDQIVEDFEEKGIDVILPALTVHKPSRRHALKMKKGHARKLRMLAKKKAHRAARR